MAAIVVGCRRHAELLEVRSERRSHGTDMRPVRADRRDAAQAPLGVDAGRGARPGRSPVDARRRASHAHCRCGHPVSEICSSPRPPPRWSRRVVAVRRSEACHCGEHCRTRGSDGRAAGDGRAQSPRRCCLRAEPSRRCLYVALEPTRGKCVSRASVGRAQNVSGGALKGSWFPTNERGRVGESPVVHSSSSSLNGTLHFC